MVKIFASVQNKIRSTSSSWISPDKREYALGTGTVTGWCRLRRYWLHRLSCFFQRSWMKRPLQSKKCVFVNEWRSCGGEVGWGIWPQFRWEIWPRKLRHLGIRDVTTDDDFWFVANKIWSDDLAGNVSPFWSSLHCGSLRPIILSCMLGHVSISYLLHPIMYTPNITTRNMLT